MNTHNHDSYTTPASWWPTDFQPAARFPGGHPVTITVACQTGDGQGHPVTIDPDWSLQIPHDPYLAQVAHAFSGGSPCADLDRILPAVVDTWLHAQRLVPPPIRATPTGEWAPTQPQSGCCRGLSWANPQQPARHLRDIKHWANLHQAPEEYARIVLRQIQVTSGSRFEPDWSPRHHDWRWDASPPATKHPDLWDLWEAGIPPSIAMSVHIALGLDGPADPMDYIRILTEPTDIRRLARQAKGDPSALTRALTSTPSGGHPDAWPDASCVATNVTPSRPERRNP